MNPVRSSTFESGLGEPDQDANSALTELDKSKVIVLSSTGTKIYLEHNRSILVEPDTDLSIHLINN